MVFADPSETLSHREYRGMTDDDEVAVQTSLSARWVE